MARARNIIEGIDDPESFDVQGHLESPVARLAITNSFVRDDRNDSEERYVKKLSNGQEAWLRTHPRSPWDEDRPMDPRDPARSGGREWEFILYTPGNPPKHEQLARANEMVMNYLLGALLQRLATWNPRVPKPKLEALGVPDPDMPSKEHMIHMGRAGECQELCPHCGAYCTLLHYDLRGERVPRYHICQTCDLKTVEPGDTDGIERAHVPQPEP